MPNVLILFAHPRFERSRANRILVRRLADKQGVTFHDLYEAYPDFFIDVKREKELLQAHDIIVMQHPFYWFSGPPLLKQWMDLVLEFGWAYGPMGNSLKGKQCFNVITASESKTFFLECGKTPYTINHFLLPFEQTAKRCGMAYLPPFIVYEANRQPEAALEGYAEHFVEVIDMLREGLKVESVSGLSTLNELNR